MNVIASFLMYIDSIIIILISFQKDAKKYKHFIESNSKT